MPRLNRDEAEEAAGVIEKLFADLEDLRDFARHHDAEHLGTRTRESVARVTLLNVMSAATGGDLFGVDEGLRTVAEDAVEACLPVLPIVGSVNSGYDISKPEHIHEKVMATKEEWVTAAFAIVDLYRRLRGTDARGDGVHRPGEPGTDDDPAGADHGGDQGTPEAGEGR